MRTYELMLIVHPDTAGDAYTAVVDKFREILVQQQCEVLKVEEWGVRKLAYPINKQNRGSYVLFYFNSPPQVLAEIERRLRIDDTIMRFMVVQREQGFEPPKDVVAAPVAEEVVAALDADEADVEEAEEE